MTDELNPEALPKISFTASLVVNDNGIFNGKLRVTTKFKNLSLSETTKQAVRQKTELFLYDYIFENPHQTINFLENKNSFEAEIALVSISKGQSKLNVKTNLVADENSTFITDLSMFFASTMMGNELPDGFVVDSNMCNCLPCSLKNQRRSSLDEDVDLERLLVSRTDLYVLLRLLVTSLATNKEYKHSTMPDLIKMDDNFEAAFLSRTMSITNNALSLTTSLNYTDGDVNLNKSLINQYAGPLADDVEQRIIHCCTRLGAYLVSKSDVFKDDSERLHTIIISTYVMLMLHKKKPLDFSIMPLMFDKIIVDADMETSWLKEIEFAHSNLVDIVFGKINVAAEHNADFKAFSDKSIGYLLMDYG